MKLTKYLMEKFNIPADRVVRHFDVNGKYCPGVVGWNSATGDGRAWKAFKQRLIGVTPTPEPTPTPGPSTTVYRVQVGAYQRKSGATNKKNAVKNTTGYDCFIEQDTDGMYRVYCGSFSVKANAEKRMSELKTKGIDCFVKEVNV